ncbi:MAG: 4Fe-4S binding protein [Chloroflexi bacterium]|jgi:ferredoxin|nr:4Fe-4S binding protein [Chloroflexota bacterium]MBT7081401.1 4Fe-4S binding protein [Chloroflexota bacterium]MBT7290449.1 4Fe-4S binding protein [Chloroflexota bacterium]
MALRINIEKCTACGKCQSVCSYNAIYESRIPDPEECEHCDVCIGMNCDFFAEGEKTYVIDSYRCTECIEDSDAPKCIASCPVNDCIEPDPYFKETREQLLEKRTKLTKK